MLLTSCSITRRVPDDKYLLDKVNVKIETAEKVDIKTGELQKYIRQKPNKRILLFRFYLRLYNAAKPHKYTGISRWLKTIGEEPVILDSTQTQRTSVNLKKYLDSKGYYNSLVSDNTEYGNKKATVSYTIKPGLPYKVKNINYVIEDPDIRQIVLNDTCNSILSKGKNFDMDLLQDERTRIEKLLKEEGYYFFSHDYITFNADKPYREAGRSGFEYPKQVHPRSVWRTNPTTLQKIRDKQGLFLSKLRSGQILSVSTI